MIFQHTSNLRYRTRIWIGMKTVSFLSFDKYQQTISKTKTRSCEVWLVGGRQEGGASQFQLFRLSLPDQGAVAVWDQGIRVIFRANFATIVIFLQDFFALRTRVSGTLKKRKN
jgi:hypothetical protein